MRKGKKSLHRTYLKKTRETTKGKKKKGKRLVIALCLEGCPREHPAQGLSREGGLKGRKQEGLKKEKKQPDCMMGKKFSRSIPSTKEDRKKIKKGQ